jgi:hypothetical protein
MRMSSPAGSSGGFAGAGVIAALCAAIIERVLAGQQHSFKFARISDEIPASQGRETCEPRRER